MTDTTLQAPILAARRRPRRARLRPPVPTPIRRRPWLTVAVIVLLVSIGFVVATGVRPAYDAYGWLVWGRQAARLHLDTNAAPSWKPLTFLFTFPYALVVGRAALWLWMVTATAAGMAAAVFAGRIAYRLSAPDGGHRYAALAAALFAGAGVVGIEGYWHFVLIATADPMIVALSLAAIDCALCKRLGSAWALLVLVCLGRPEGLPIVLAYAVWAWWKVPRLRAALAGGLVAIPLLWFGVPAVTSSSWMIAGNVLGESTAPLSGSKFSGVLSGFVSLYEAPMQIAALFAAVLAVVLRLRTWLLLLAAAVAWLAVEVAFALHGWGVAPRYMFEPAAVMVVLAGASVGRALAADPVRPAPLRWLALAAVLVLVGTLVPHARIRGRLVHNGIVLGRTWARQIHRLHAVIAEEGGPKRILACGQPVTEVPYQSILAWELDRNVIDVGWDPRLWTALHVPIVLFEPQGAGWRVQALNPSGRQHATALRLPASTPSNDVDAVRASIRTYGARADTPLPVRRAACDRLAATTAVN